MLLKLKQKFYSKFPGLWLYKSLLKDQKSFLWQTGWKESLKRGYPSKADGSELPWMNYSIISFLENRLRDDMKLFEFGSGYSTIFYARRVRFVRTIEYDKKWFELIKKKLPSNAEIHFVEKDADGDYCRSINLTDELYDVVIVDGRDRVNCLKQAVEKLSARGVVILDDSQRERYQDGINYLTGKGFSRLDFSGLGPLDYAIVTTTVFYRPGNCLGV